MQSTEIVHVAFLCTVQIKHLHLSHNPMALVPAANVVQQPLAQAAPQVAVSPSEVGAGQRAQANDVLNAGSLASLKAFLDLGVINRQEAQGIINSDPFLQQSLIDWSDIFTNGTRDEQDKYRLQFGTGMSGALAFNQARINASQILRQLNEFADRQYVENPNLRNNIAFQ
jgi:hypothetical protein